MLEVRKPILASENSRTEFSDLKAWTASYRMKHGEEMKDF